VESEKHSALDVVRAQLRRLRTAAGLSQEEFGKRIHYSTSMVSAIEVGQRPLDRKTLARADEALDTGGLLVYLLGVAERENVPSWFRPWREVEEAATQLRLFQPNLVPGLLQTEEYARAVVRMAGGRTEAEVEKLVAGRMQRQELLHREHPPQVTAVVDETALRRVGEGFTALMGAQLRHLRACAELPEVSVHVIPADVVLHVGLNGPFDLARTPDGGWVGQLDTALGGDLIDREDRVARLLSQWERVRSEALSRRQSLDLITELEKIHEPD
jgi:transcriptional regulator with XRE-family HTH domain